LLLSFPAPDRQMRILGAIVFSQSSGVVTIGTAELIECRPIRSQAIGDE
jgi:hypothetical protein